MTRSLALLLAPALTLALALAAAPAAAQDVMAGRRLANRQCAACHGPQGIATLPEAANLAGQDATYLTRQLQAFRSGARVHELMTVVSKTLTDEQVADLAAFYAKIEVEVVRVPGS